MNHFDPHPVPIAPSYRYLPNPNGNRTQVTDTIGGVSKVTTYGYDDLDRLNAVQYGEGDCQAYTYDSVGNRKTLTATPKVTLPCDGAPVTTTTAYDAVDQITAMTGVTGVISYDKNGNLLSLGTPAGTASLTTFLYDQENRLFRTGACRGDFNNDGAVNPGDQALLASRVTVAEGLSKYDLLFDVNSDRTLNPGDQALVASEVGNSYSSTRCKSTGPTGGSGRSWYNGDGLRVRSKTFPAAGNVDNDPVWDVGSGLPNVLVDKQTVSATSTTTYTKFVYGLGLISTTDNAGAPSYYLADGLVSTTQLVTSTGALTGDAYTYDVFGVPRTTTGATANDFRFTGQQADTKAARGLYYLRARHYDPALGRFLGWDPSGVGHPYSYGANSPPNYGDPSGLIPCGFLRRACDAVGGTIGCALGPGACAFSLFTGSFLDRALVGVAGATAARLANSTVKNKEGGIRLIENCSSAFCSGLFASTKAGVSGLQAITIGDTILAPGQCGPTCFRHESVHVRQFRDLGLVGFVEEYYGTQSAKNLFNCLGAGSGIGGCLYQNNGLEREADRAG